MARVLYLQADSGKNSGQFLIDAKTRERPVISDGTSLTVRLGSFHFDTPTSLANLTQLNFEFRKTSSDSETPFLSRNVTLPIANEEILLSAWNSKSSWNAEIDFTSEELNYDIPDESDHADLFLIITATFSSGSQNTLGAGTIRIAATNDSGASESSFMLKSVYDANNDGIVDQAAVADSVDWSNISSKPTSFTPSTHSHTKSEISNLASFSGAGEANLVPDPVSETGKFLQDDGTWVDLTVSWSDITGVPSDFIPGDHSHTKSEITDLAAFSGAGEANLVPDPSTEIGKFLRDDGSWATESDFSGNGASGLVPNPGSETGKFLRDDGTWATASGSVAWADITGKPSSFTPSSHTHLRAEITDLYNFSGAGSVGLVPDPTVASGKFLQDDGSWSSPNIPSIPNFSGAGYEGLVPDPVTETGGFLKDDGSWEIPSVSSSGAVTASAATETKQFDNSTGLNLGATVDKSIGELRVLNRDPAVTSEEEPHAAQIFELINAVVNSRDVTDITSNEFTLSAGQEFNTGQCVVIRSTGDIPTGVVQNQLYWISSGASSFKLHNNYADALSDDSPVTVTDSGTGTVTFYQANYPYEVIPNDYDPTTNARIWQKRELDPLVTLSYEGEAPDVELVSAGYYDLGIVPYPIVVENVLIHSLNDNGGNEPYLDLEVNGSSGLKDGASILGNTGGTSSSGSSPWYAVYSVKNAFNSELRLLSVGDTLSLHCEDDGSASGSASSGCGVTITGRPLRKVHTNF